MYIGCNSDRRECDNVKKETGVIVCLFFTLFLLFGCALAFG